MSAAAIQKAQSWLDHVVENDSLSVFAHAIAILLAQSADAFGNARTPDVKRLARTFKAPRKAIVAAIGELVDQGYLDLRPQDVQGGCYLIAGGSERRVHTEVAAVAADIIPFSHSERCRRLASMHAARMAAMPRAKAESYLRRLLTEKANELRMRGAHDDAARHAIDEFGGLIRAAYWRAVLTPGKA